MTGAELIAAERQRQIEQEGWTAEHDDHEHADGDLTKAAQAYLHVADRLVSDPPAHDLEASQRFAFLKNYMPDCWPWNLHWWKPSELPVRNLVKAGALIAAEIDRLQRIPTRSGKVSETAIRSADDERAKALVDAAREYVTKEPHETDGEFRDRQRFCEGKLIGLTIGMGEHPEFMNELVTQQLLPCACDECSDCG